MAHTLINSAHLPISKIMPAGQVVVFLEMSIRRGSTAFCGSMEVAWGSFLFKK